MTIDFPSGLNAAILTLHPSHPISSRQSPFSRLASRQAPSCLTHIRTVLSSEAVTIDVPSRLNIALLTPSSRAASRQPVSCLTHTSVALSTVITIDVPSGVNGALLTK